jgi:glycosyltransferase involved in cell wall biosynthesis
VAHHHLLALASRHELHLVAGGETPPPAELASRLASVAHEPPAQGSGARRYARAALHMFRGLPPWIGVFASGRLSAQVRRRWAQGGWDALLAFELGAVQFVPAAAHRRLVVNVEDPQSIRFERMKALDVWSPAQRARLEILARTTRRYERRTLPRLGKVLLLSAADAADFAAEEGHANLGVVPYGVAIPPGADRLPLEGRDRGLLVVSGNMFHPPNVDGVLHLLAEVLPRVLAQRPAARLAIVGADPDPRLRAAATRFGDRVELTGHVPDVSAYLRRAMASLCPVRLRVGVQTKILEALAWGTPVVSTRAGNAGVAGRAGEELWEEDDPAAFAARVVSLLDGHAWTRLSEGGAALVAGRHSWARSAEALDAHLRAVVPLPA